MPRRKQPSAKHKKASPRATVKMKNHKPGAHNLAGSVERLMVFRRKAMELKMRGFKLHEIAREITREFNLEQAPAIPTISAWIEECFKEAFSDQKIAATQYANLAEARSEEIIRTMWPIAMGETKIARIVGRGEEAKEIIDEANVEERVKAAEVIRRNIETVCKVRGIGRVGAEGGGPGDSKAISAIVMQVVNNIVVTGQHLPEEKRAAVLEMRAGDPRIDDI